MISPLLQAVREPEQKVDEFRRYFIEGGVSMEANLYMDLRDRLREIEATVHILRAVAAGPSVGGSNE